MHQDKNIIIEPKDLPDMLKQLENGFYAIPMFQRDFVWDLNNIKSLWDSIYRHYPIGSFLIWETKEKLPSHRDILGITLKENEKGNFNYILDGQQRITSLLGSIKGAKRPNKKNKTFALFFNLKKAMTEKIEEEVYSNELESTPFLDEDEYEDLTIEDKKFVIPVSYLIEYNRDFDIGMHESGHKDVATFYHSICERFKSKYKLSIIKLNEIPIDEVCEIFTRVNQKGKKLTLVELITAKTFRPKSPDIEEFFLAGRLNYLYNEELERVTDSFSEAIDQAIFLRLISVINLKLCRERDLLTLDTETIEKTWEEAKISYIKAIRYLNDELRIKSPYIIPYPPMLVPLSYFFYVLGNKPLTNNLKSILNSWFWINSFSGTYQGATNEKIHLDCELFNKVILTDTKPNIRFNKKIDVYDIINQEISLTSAFCKSLLCILSYLGPKDFRNHNNIGINEILIKSKKNQLHHIFPIKSIIGKKYSESLINSVTNVCFLPGDTNNFIKNKNPGDYFREFKKDNPHFDEDVRSHIIPIEEALKNDFENFIKKRAELIKGIIYDFVGITPNIERQIKESPDVLWNGYELAIRNTINSKLTEKYGGDYWTNNIIPEDIKFNIDERIKKEIKLRPDLKEQFEIPRAKLDNCDVMDYMKIILKNWEIFESTFGSKEETQNQFKNMQVFRNALKHVKDYNEEGIDDLTRKKGEVSLLWLEKILKLNQAKEQEMKIDFTPIDEVYEELVKRIKGLGEDIKEKHNKYYTAFEKDSNFVSLQLQNSKIKMWLRIPREKLKDERKIVRDVSNLGHHGTGQFEATLNSKENLDYIFGLIKQAYDNNPPNVSGDYDLDYHLSKIKDENIRSKVIQLKEKILSNFNDVKEHHSKLHIKFKHKADFCSIYCQKDNFWVDIKLSKEKINDKSLDIRPVKDDTWTHIRMNKETDLERLMPYIKQAFEEN